jgi:hypothetical protein
MAAERPRRRDSLFPNNLAAIPQGYRQWPGTHIQPLARRTQWPCTHTAVALGRTTQVPGTHT